MTKPGTDRMPPDFAVVHPVDPEDAPITAALHTMASATKGVRRGIEAREQFDALMENVQPRGDVAFEPNTLGGVPGFWINPVNRKPDAAILHLHGGWFNFGSAKAYRHLVGHIAARTGARAFVPDYRLAPEHPFPAATDDALACYRGLVDGDARRVVLTGDSAGGNLALGLASRIINSGSVPKGTLVGIAALSPVTDLALTGESYQTRADADPFFTRQQVAELVRSYLGTTDSKLPLASPLYAQLSGLPPIRIHVGDDEVLLDDSVRYVEQAIGANVDAGLDVWLGMPHGFQGSVGKLRAAAKSLDAIGAFLGERLGVPTSS
jgi:monoterpene epsilon-lactone hydrolase